MIARVFEKMGSMLWARWMIYKAVSQLVLLYGSESSVFTGEMLKLLEEFHHQASNLITGMTETHGSDREW